MSVDGVATIQARMAQITSLVSPSTAVTTTETDAASTTAFASELDSALGLFNSGASAQTSLASSLSAMLGGASFTSGVSSSSSILGMLANAVGGVSSASTATSVTSATTSQSSGPTGQDLVDAAREYLGVKYVWGGESLSEGGLDCSGLVLRSFTDLGVDGIPRVAKDQGKIGTEVASMDEAKTGDLLIFDGGSHIGIYIGDGKMIDAPYRGSYVQERDVYETPTSIRRVL